LFYNFQVAGRGKSERIWTRMIGRAVAKVFRVMQTSKVFDALKMIAVSIDEEVQSILDVGCGKGEKINYILKEKRYDIIGLDGFLPYIEICKSKNIFSDLIYCNIRYMPIREKSFDAVLLLAVIEHLRRDHAVKLLKELDAIARKQIVLSTNVGPIEQDALDGNPHQVHKSAWNPQDLRSLGFTIVCRLNGLRVLYDAKGHYRFSSEAHCSLMILNAILVLFSQLISYFVPHLGIQFLAVRFPNLE